MPAKAGIQAFFLDSRYKHAGMTYGDMVTQFRGAVLREQLLMDIDLLLMESIPLNLCG